MTAEAQISAAPAPTTTSRKIQPGALTLVHFVEKQLEGWTFARSHWPLHITLVPWFQTKDEEAVMRSLDRLAAELENMNLTVGGVEDVSGPGHRQANFIKNQQPVRELHKYLLATLERADIELHESRFTGKEYRAHVTRHRADGRHSTAGEHILLNDFHLVKMLDAKTCEVYQVFELIRR